ncbi:MAG: PfkB family carbohydrate kinase, partial [Patescibacteria group bacterium]
FYEKTAEIFSALVDFAKEKNIKIAVNPSIEQIEKGEQSFEKSLSKADILFLNKEEAAILTKSPEASIEELFIAIRKICPGIIVITQGDKGAVVFEGENLYKADTYKVAVEDKTGAGDSFAAGFMAGLLKENDIEYAIRLGMINSAKNISQKGAKIGLLNKSELKILPKIDIIKERAC